jgi:hypothetical protein
MSDLSVLCPLTLKGHSSILAQMKNVMCKTHAAAVAAHGQSCY